MMNDDMALVREYAASQSEQAFSTLVSRHVHLVHAAALRQMRDPRRAEEITQAVFIILARKAGSLSPQTILSGWLYRTAHFVAADALKTQRRRRLREQEAQMEAIIDLPQSDAAWAQLSPLLDEAMARLRDRDRDAVILRYFENKSLQEVGAALGVEKNTAQKRIARSLEKLHRYFARRGVSSTTAIIAGAMSAHSVQAAPAVLAKTVTAVAVAKGAAASGSTLTLIKGALKIMAWTKAKTVIVSGVVVLLAAGTATVTVKEIAARRAEASWRVPNPDPDRAPLRVEILPTKFGNLGISMNVGSRGDNWIGIDTGVKGLAYVAYGARPGRILFPDGEPLERFDFISTLPHASGAALQTELKQKLGFVGRREMRDMDVLVLKVRKPNAPGLKPPTHGNRDYANNGHYYCDNAPISSDSGYFPGIARLLEAYFQTPVIDQTGLSRNFHIDLKWDERFGEDPNHDALKLALLDQLGLELVPGRESIEMLVVEKAKD